MEQIHKEIVEEFELFDLWEDKYAYLIDLGRDIPLIDEQFKTEDYLVRGCQSKVWLYCEHKDDKLYFTADSDALITKGIVSLIVRAYSGFNPLKIIEINHDFIDKIGLSNHLSMTRANGLVAMINKIKTYGKQYAK